MRFNPVLASALYTAVLLGQAQADVLDDATDGSSTSIAESATPSVVEKPTFTVSYPPMLSPKADNVFVD